MRVAGLHQFARVLPERDGAIDVGLSLVLQAEMRLLHRRRKNREQHVAIVYAAERVLELRKALGRRLQPRLEHFESFQGVAQPLTSDAKVVEPLLVATIESAGQRARLVQARIEDALDYFLHPANAR